MKNTLVLGASLNPSRVSHLAVHRLRSEGHNVVAVGGRAGHIADVEVLNDAADIAKMDFHTISLYLNAQRQEQYYDLILNLKPKRLIFNPGAENHFLYSKAKEAGIEVENYCMMVQLSLQQY